MSGRVSRDPSIERGGDRYLDDDRDKKRDTREDGDTREMDGNRSSFRDDNIRDRNERSERDDRSPPPRETKIKTMDESSRQARWTSLLKSRLSFGFHHLSPAHLPSMTEDRRAYALCFEKITNWHLPDSVLKAFGKGDYEITVQLSLSFYHLNSASFFGSTWMGPAISLGGSDRKLPTTIDFEYSDIVYLISRISDPTCVAVIEIVASKYDNVRDLVAMQFG